MRLWHFAIAAGLYCASAVLMVAVQVPPRVRGRIVGVRQHTLTVRTASGQVFRLNTDPHTTYAYVVPAEISSIQTGDFLGTAVKGRLDKLTAVELALIPPDMQAGRISLYPWDPLPDPSAGALGTLVPTRMTNGVVARVHAVGSVCRTFTIAYNGGKQSFEIRVPASAPVVRYIRSHRSAVRTDSSVMIKTIAGDHVDLVTVGKGISPPM